MGPKVGPGTRPELLGWLKQMGEEVLCLETNSDGHGAVSSLLGGGGEAGRPAAPVACLDSTPPSPIAFGVPCPQEFSHWSPPRKPADATPDEGETWAPGLDGLVTPNDFGLSQPPSSLRQDGASCCPMIPVISTGVAPADVW